LAFGNEPISIATSSATTRRVICWVVQTLSVFGRHFGGLVQLLAFQVLHLDEELLNHGQGSAVVVLTPAAEEVVETRHQCVPESDDVAVFALHLDRRQPRRLHHRHAGLERHAALLLRVDGRVHCTAPQTSEPASSST
jgi:hypothetical protein